MNIASQYSAPQSRPSPQRNWFPRLSLTVAGLLLTGLLSPTALASTPGRFHYYTIGGQQHL